MKETIKLPISINIKQSTLRSIHICILIKAKKKKIFKNSEYSGRNLPALTMPRQNNREKIHDWFVQTRGGKSVWLLTFLTLLPYPLQLVTHIFSCLCVSVAVAVNISTQHKAGDVNK